MGADNVLYVLIVEIWFIWARLVQCRRVGLNRDVGQLFEPAPATWGLRGDPYLWRELQASLSGVLLPESVEELKAIIEAEFEKITGYKISHPENFKIARFAHGGMSSGMVSPPFWREKGLPLIISRGQYIINTIIPSHE